LSIVFIGCNKHAIFLHYRIYNGCKVFYDIGSRLMLVLFIYHWFLQRRVKISWFPGINNVVYRLKVQNWQW
jgi:hypothetical protein